VAESEKKFTKISTLKKGGYVLIDEEPCQIRGIEKSKPGKHGATKARISAFNIFTGQKKGLLKPTSAEAQVPIILKRSAQVVAIIGDSVQIMDLESYEMLDAKKPKDISLEGGKGTEVEYQRYGANVKIVRKKG